MKPYPRYKPTGLAWLPSVPEHWEATKIRTIFTERTTKVSDKDYPPLSVSKGGVVPQIETVAKSDDSDNRKLVRIGDFVINSRSDRKGSSGVSELDGSVSLVNLVLKPRKKGNGRFLHYLLKSDPFVEEFYRNGHGIVADLWTTRYSEMKSIYIPLPPPSEQDRIVRYLDEKTAAIDELVRAKEREIELLRERKQALVSAAVIGRDISMKCPFGRDASTMRPGCERAVGASLPEFLDSGIPWIGKIPKGWKVVKLRQILSPVSEKNRPDLPLLSVVREKGVIIRDKDDMEENRNFIPDDLSGYKVVRKGQFAMNKMKAWQGSYGVSPYDGIVSPAYFVFNIRFDNPEYFHLAIRSKVYVDFFAQASDGIRIGQWDLNLTKMKEIPFLVPPASGQKEIVERMPVLFAETDRKIALAEKSIALLQELRTRLVSDAVTGAVEVD